MHIRSEGRCEREREEADSITDNRDGRDKARK